MESLKKTIALTAKPNVQVAYLPFAFPTSCEAWTDEVSSFIELSATKELTYCLAIKLISKKLTAAEVICIKNVFVIESGIMFTTFRTKKGWSWQLSWFQNIFPSKLIVLIEIQMDPLFQPV